MKIIALILCLALPAYAQEAMDDAPTVTCLTPQQEINLAMNIVKMKTENEELKKHVGISTPVFVTIIVGSIALGVASTVAVY